jgi:hypothetical protein
VRVPPASSAGHGDEVLPGSDASRPDGHAEQQIKALGHVTAAHLKFSKGTFGGSSDWYTGDITSDATDQATLNGILDSCYKIIWMAPGVTAAIVNPVVMNPVTGQGAGFHDLGLNVPPAAPDLESRYGPRP